MMSLRAALLMCREWNESENLRAEPLTRARGEPACARLPDVCERGSYNPSSTPRGPAACPHAPHPAWGILLEEWETG